jgi:lipoyl(octanoyl) transferase
VKMLREDDARAALQYSREPQAYDAAMAAMEARVGAIIDGQAPELVWFLEHEALYTAGTKAKPEDLFNPFGLPVHQVGRGGELTYHGPGQRIVYLMLDLNHRGRDVRRFVCAIEAVMINALALLGVSAHTSPDRVGVWVQRPDKGEGYEDKIGAIGIRLRRWVSFHGFALNDTPNLAHFSGIVPCGIRAPQFGVTSLQALGMTHSRDRVDAALKKALHEVFGPLDEAPGKPPQDP